MSMETMKKMLDTVVQRLHHYGLQYTPSIEYLGTLALSHSEVV